MRKEQRAIGTLEKLNVYIANVSGYLKLKLLSQTLATGMYKKRKLWPMPFS